MRRYTLITAVLLLTAVSVAVPQEKPKYLGVAAKNYLSALRHQNQGVVESAVFNIMKLKLVYPDLHYDTLAATLDSVAINSENTVLKRKAYIAAMYLKYPERFTWITNKTFELKNAFFELLALKLEKQEYTLSTEYAAEDSSR